MIVTTTEGRRGQNQRVDGSKLDLKELRDGVVNQCKALGSHAYYVFDEVERCQKDPEGIRAFLTSFGELRVYYAPKETR